MQKINNLSFPTLKNAEHVSFMHNVRVAVNALDVTALDMNLPLFSSFGTAIDAEQDIVNRSTASAYTPEMKELDDTRDRIYRLIRLRLQAVLYASADSDVAQYASAIDKYLLGKYGNDVPNAAYQEESALINGFVLDIEHYLDEDAIEAIGITDELLELKRINKQFAELYNERVSEKSGTSPELSKQLRKASEEIYEQLSTVIEYKAITDSTEIGKTNAKLIDVINQLIKEAQTHVDMRLGRRKEEEE